MQVLTTIGPDDATRAVLPFMAAKGAMAHGDSSDFFFMQESTYLGSKRHSNLSELKAPGLPTVQEVLRMLQDADAVGEAVVCEPCATAREITEDQLRDWATFGDAGDLYAQLERNEEAVSF